MLAITFPNKIREIGQYEFSDSGLVSVVFKDNGVLKTFYMGESKLRLFPILYVAHVLINIILYNKYFTF